MSQPTDKCKCKHGRRWHDKGTGYCCYIPQDGQSLGCTCEQFRDPPPSDTVTVRRADLAGIEYAGNCASEFGNVPICPGCGREEREGHASDCWIGNALKETPPWPS